MYWRYPIFARKFDQKSDASFRQAVPITGQLNVVPNIPRVAKKQIYWDNLSANSPDAHYKRAVVIPIVDTFIAKIIHRFNNFNCKVGKLLIFDNISFTLWKF